MSERIVTVDCFIFERQREQPYLGAIGPHDVRLGERYIIRGFNGTVYPLVDRSVVVRIRDQDGAEGWGETYGLVAPKATIEIIQDLFAPYLLASPLAEPDVVWDTLYNLMRVRGYWGGYYGDALAAVDIALWDLKGRREGLSLGVMLGGKASGFLPGYISGLPRPTHEERLAMALEWREKGFTAVKFPIGHAKNGLAAEYEFLRQRLGSGQRIAVDLHWAYTPDEIVAMAESVASYDPWFFEAPVAPEDIAAQAEVAQRANVPIALGEEWRTLWDYIPRRDAKTCSIVQPEMGHTGITQFMRIGWAARAAGSQIIPHATIGLGLFLAASVRAAAVLEAEAHEFQHTVFVRNAELLSGALNTTVGGYQFKDSPGHGVVPTLEAERFLTLIESP